MRGLLADVNLQGHLDRLRRRIAALGLWLVLDELGLTFATFADLGLAADLDDRSIWRFCQDQGWVLFTANRNDDGPTSLQATLRDSWSEGCFPVLTLGSRLKFESQRDYADRVAEEVAELLFDIHGGENRDQGRIYVPRTG